MPVSNKYYRYNHSLKGIARRDRHWQTGKYRLTVERFLAKHGGLAAYSRERYHEIQDAAGCHSAIRDFYPSYRLLQALVSAEVIEV